jgi:hypothetical protein
MSFVSVLLRMILCLAFLAPVTLPRRAAAQASEITPAVEYTFGGQMSFRLNFTPETPIRAAQVFLRSAGDAQTLSGDLLIGEADAVYVQDLTNQPLRAFSPVEYWFHITPQTGEAYYTEKQSFLYLDNRFQWQTLEDELFRVHWYSGDAAFGQSLMDAAHAGLDRAEKLLKLGERQPVDIYVYASGKELQSTLRLGGLNWVAGHADPDMNLMVVSLPAGPDQKRETERQIPHELMHILLYQAVGKDYENLPIWFREGMSSANELRPNSDYYLILEQASEQDSLIRLQQLCDSFPKDSSAYLAYAEADSFTRFLYQKYGSAGLSDLMQSYAGGEGCEYGSQTSLGLSLTRLEKDWLREALGESVVLSALMNLLPWLFLLLVGILAPLLLLLLNLRKKDVKKEPGVSYG